MEKRGWIILLIVVAVLAVVSVINITGFAVETYSEDTSIDKSGAATNTIVKDPEDAVQIQFPGSGRHELDPVQSGNSPSGGEDPNTMTPYSSNGSLPDEFHWGCSGNQCALIPGPGGNTCESNDNCAPEPVCGDGYCEDDEDEVTCLEDCPVIDEENPDEEVIRVPLPVIENPSLGDEGYDEYIKNSFATCTNKFDFCVRVPKIIGDERDICDDVTSCKDIQKALDERATEYVQLSSSTKDVSVVRLLLQRFFGFGV